MNRKNQTIDIVAEYENRKPFVAVTVKQIELATWEEMQAIEQDENDIERSNGNTRHAHYRAFVRGCLVSKGRKDSDGGDSTIRYYSQKYGIR